MGVYLGTTIKNKYMHGFFYLEKKPDICTPELFILFI